MHTTPEPLRRLAHLTPAEGRARVHAWLDALPAMADRDARHALARSLPHGVAMLPPAVCLALSRLAEKLVAQTPAIPNDLAALAPQLRVPWRRVEIALGRIPSDDAELLRCTAGWSIDAVLHPVPLLQRMLAATDARLRHLGLRWLAPAVSGLGLSAALAFDILSPLTGDAEPSLRLAAFQCPHFCATGLSLQQESTREDQVLAGLNDPEPRVIRAALMACARLERRDWLLDYLTDTARPVALRAIAMTALGPLAEAIDLPIILETSETLGFEAACRSCLLDAHRHGAFIDTAQIAPLLAQYDRWPAWTADEIVRISFTQRDTLLAQLAQMPFDDVRWTRRALLLAESSMPAAVDLLDRALTETQDVHIGTACVLAASRMPAFTNEISILKWLERAPEATLRATRVKGDEHAAWMLTEFVLTPGVDHTVRAQALDVLWTLTVDRAGLLAKLSAQLGPAAAGLLNTRRRLSLDAKAEVLARAPWNEERFPLSPAVQLRAWCASSDPRFVPDVEHLFRTQVTDCVRRALAGDFRAKRIELPALEQQIYAYGRRLIAHGHRVRNWVDDAPSTGRDLLFAFIRRWLGDTPERAVLVALFEMAERHVPDSALLRCIEPYWRNGHREVRRAAIDAILAADGEGLSFSLSRLVAHPSPRIAERGLAALRVFGDPQWAEPWARRALERPEMAVKKAAAEALARCGTAASVPALVGWLGRHDNAGFRQFLAAALTHSAGADATRALVDALDACTDARTHGLLLEALQRRLTLAGLCRVLRAQRPAAQALVDAAIDGHLTLADATTAQVRAHLHQVRLVERAPTPVNPVNAFNRLGFSPETAAALIAHWPKDDGAILKAVRRVFAEWVRWCADAPALALRIALMAAKTQQQAQFPALLDQLPMAPTDAALDFLSRCLVQADPRLKWQAIDIVRALPPAPEPGGWARYRLLGALGAQRTADDLRACLAECAQGPAFDRRSLALLEEALALANGAQTEAVRALRETAARWHQMSAAKRDAWLTQTLAERPLGLPTPAELPRLNALPKTALTAVDLARLQTELMAVDTQAAAVHTLLNAPIARPVWPDLLTRWLAGTLTVAPGDLAVLASVLIAWPTAPRARQLLPHLSKAQLRQFIPGWIAARAQGDAEADAILRQVGEPLRPFIWAAKDGDPTLARLVPMDLPLRDWLAEHAPAELPPERPVHIVESSSADPLEELDLKGLSALVNDKKAADGLTVRAVHAAAQHTDAAIEIIAGWAVDARPRIRSAALRALRSIAPRIRSMQATAAALEIETRRQEVMRLLRILGHGRFAVDAITARLTHRDAKIAGAAHDALRAFGRDALPALHRARRKARPDRRVIYTRIIDVIDD